MSDTASKRKADQESNDVPDAKFLGLGGGRPNRKSAVPVLGSIEVGREDRLVYNMNHKKRGLFLIINNRNFKKQTGQNDRAGTDIDADILSKKFEALGFHATILNNLTCEQMVETMKAAAKEDHSNADCFGCAILSHGKDEGEVYGTNGTLKLDTLVESFKGSNCPSLVGKPKLFFIQACRGETFDHGVDVADAMGDEGKSVKRIPKEADFLFAYSTTPGYYAWRNTGKGSWFVQALGKVLEDYGDKEEIMWLMTRVNGLVAFEFQSSTADQAKQIPSIVSQLTKRVFFLPK